MLHEWHSKAAAHHELPAKAHRTASKQNEKSPLTNALWLAERAMEFSEKGYQLEKESHNRAELMVSL